MNNLLSVFMAAIALISVSCADSISDVEKTYQSGIERAEAAKTPEELSQITVDVRNQLINGAKGIGGNRRLNESEMQRYSNAQHKFEQAIEDRHHQLTRHSGIWRYAD